MTAAIARGGGNVTAAKVVISKQRNQILKQMKQQSQSRGIKFLKRFICFWKKWNNLSYKGLSCLQ